MRGCIAAVGFMLFQTFVSGQAVLTVDKTAILIGEQVQATVTIPGADVSQWINRDAIWPDSLQGIEIVSAPGWSDGAAAGHTSATWTLAVFDTGYVRLPALMILVDRGGRVDTMITHDVPILVMGVEPDTTGLREIKALESEPFRPGYYLKKYLPHALVALALIAGLLLWLRQQKNRKAVSAPLLPPPPSHEWALQALTDLETKRLWQHGEVKEHYTLLTAILREYLERQYGIHALEQTSDEIIAQLHQHHLSETLLTDTGELLSVADLIKFAKADPGIDIHAATIGRVRAFVKETAQASRDIMMDEKHTTPGDEIVE